MATLSDGYMGGFSGTLGTAVGYSWRGQWCLRSRPGRVRNPRTERQQAHRQLFKREVQLAGRMNRVLRATFDGCSYERHMTPCNYFIQRNQHAFTQVDGELVVDWSALVLCEGPVAPVEFYGLEVKTGNVLSLKFYKNPTHQRADAYDEVSLYLFCPSLERGYLSAPVYRRDGMLEVALPDEFAGFEVQLWGMVEDRQGRWSETLYIGYGPLDEAAAGTSASQDELGDVLHVLGVGEHVDGLDSAHVVSLGQQAKVAGLGGGVAADVDDLARRGG